MNRQPKNPQALLAALRTWAQTEPGDHEADIAFEAVLLEQGVLNPEDIVEEMEGDGNWAGMIILLAGGQEISITEDGRVNYC